MTTPVCIVTLILVAPTPVVTPFSQSAHESMDSIGQVQDVFKGKCSIFYLTSREMDIVRLLSEGLSYKEIAARLFISVRTVAKHIQNIFAKLNVSNKIEMINKLKGGLL